MIELYICMKVNDLLLNIKWNYLQEFQFYFSSKMSRIREIFNKYPLLRGMVSYSLIWPSSALIQQKIAGKSWGKLMKIFSLLLLIVIICHQFFWTKIQLIGQSVLDSAFMEVFMWDPLFTCGFEYRVAFFHSKLFGQQYQRWIPSQNIPSIIWQ